MSHSNLEHANLTVSNPDTTAALLTNLFNWKVRWSGPSKDGGYTVHVGSDASYIALYKPASIPIATRSDHSEVRNLNHLGVVVSDLDDVEQRVKQAGLTPFNHGDYEPGKRFYFFTSDQLEIEVVSYD